MADRPRGFTVVYTVDAASRASSLDDCNRLDGDFVAEAFTPTVDNTWRENI